MFILLVANVVAMLVDALLLHHYPDYALFYAALLAFNSFVVGLLTATLRAA